MAGAAVRVTVGRRDSSVHCPLLHCWEVHCS